MHTGCGMRRGSMRRRPPNAHGARRDAVVAEGVLSLGVDYQGGGEVGVRLGHQVLGARGWGDRGRGLSVAADSEKGGG